MATRYISRVDRHSVNTANNLSCLQEPDRRPSPFIPPTVPGTLNSRGLEVVPNPPKAGSSPIFRITGIPLSVTQKELMDILMDEFDTENGILPNAGCCSSCYDDRTQTALLEFTPRAPSILLDYLRDKSNKGYMISHPSGGDITIDQDFYGLTQLYTTSEPIKADIVAVCGLDGHAYGSWAGKEDNRGIKRMWLRDFLREDLPSCRTMIYGYDSRLRGAYGLREVPDYTNMFLEELMKARRAPEEKNRPIVFIAHSFGGILIAEAVVRAKANADKYGGLFENTKASIFYAAPHRELVVDDIISMTGDDSTREDLVKSLKNRSEGDLQRFKDCTLPYGLKIINYKEIEPAQKLIKDENSEWVRKGSFCNVGEEEPTILHLPSPIGEPLAIDGDHSTLVKFQYKAQLSYTSVLMQVEECTNDTGMNRYVPAESAIKHGTYHDLMRVLESRTVDVNSPLKHLENSPTLLHLAASTNDVRKVDLLLEKGANIEARDGKGSTATHEAIASKNIKIVELLLQRGAGNATRASFPGSNWIYELPLLHFACAEGNSGIVEILVNRGDVKLDQHAGYLKHYPLHFAAMNMDVSVLEMLITEKKVDKEVQNGYGMTALHLAAANGLERNVRSLLLHGAKIKAMKVKGALSTVLHIAIENENEAVVDILLDNGADITARGGDDNDTPLHFACRTSNEILVKSLLDRNADIEARNKPGMTPLLCAAKSGSKSIFELLARNKADLTAVDKWKRTALHLAADNLNEQLVELILSYGADIEALDIWGGTPLYAAASEKNGQMAKSLLRYGASTSGHSTRHHDKAPLQMAVLRGSYETVKHLLDNKANLQTRDEKGDTPLHTAAIHGHKEIVTLLLEHKADKDARNFSFARPIDEARRYRRLACVKLLEEVS